MPASFALLLVLAAASPEEALLVKMDALTRVEKRLEAAQQRVRSCPKAVDAGAEFESKVLAVLERRDPVAAKRFERYSVLRRRILLAVARGDQTTVTKLRPQMLPLIDVATADQTMALEAEPRLRQDAEKYFAAVEAIVSADPEVRKLTDEMGHIVVDLRAMTGDLRHAPPDGGPTITEARKKFRTQVFGPSDRSKAPEPPAGVLERVRYDAPLGKNVAYVTPVKSGPKRPAIVWLAGGFDRSIGSASWRAAPPSNDQTAAAFREAGVALMLPSLRGANDNNGRNECMYGEVDDVVAAATFLAARPDVDPERVYLAGASTGGTLALLVAAKTDMFRGVFAFGPVSSPTDYREVCTSGGWPKDEARLRAPIEFIDHIVSPTWVIEGENGNTLALLELERYAKPNVRFVEVPELGHFGVLRPGSEVIAKQIASGAALSITGAAIQQAAR